MKRLTACLLAASFAASAGLHLAAQDTPSSFGLAPSKPDVILPSGAGELPLIPDPVPQTEKPGKQEKKSATDAAEDALRQRIKIREARVKAQRDPGLQAIWAQGAAARTDYDQRKIWTDYYNQLYAMIAKIDKTLKPEELDPFRDEDISRFKQDRIAPTVPPVATPTPRPAKAAKAPATPTPRPAKRR